MSVTALVVNQADSTLREQEQALVDAGFYVITASSYDDASVILGDVRPDLLVAPVRLGTHNGIHLAIRSQSVSPMTRTLILGYADAVLERDAMDAGAAYLVEPDLPALVASARALVRRLGGRAALARRAGGRGP